MTTTTYGYRLPQTGDLAKGSSGWYASLEFNISRMDSHNHDGVNSALLTLANFTPYSNSILAAGWTADGSSGYKQTITVPGAILDINDWDVSFIFTAPAGKVGERAYLNIKKLTNTTYEVYCNDNTAAFTALYR